MATGKRKIVGLIILTDLPGEGGLVAVLQRRGISNHEKNWERESRPGGYQVTAHGGLKGNEGFLEALKREVKEELGDRFFDEISLPYWRFVDSLIVLVHDENDPEREVLTYGIFLPNDVLKLIRLNPSTGGLRFISSGGVDSIVDLWGFDKIKGVEDSNIVAMFPDEIAALKMAFKLTSH